MVPVRYGGEVVGSGSARYGVEFMFINGGEWQAMVRPGMLRWGRDG
jgi:hypothetical protein